jgi:hypothetical protein
MSKYQPLARFLKTQGTRTVPLTFKELEKILGFKLPPSAYRHRPWWANEARGHVHAKAWLDAGYETAQVDMEAKRLVFECTAYGETPMNAQQGLSEQRQDYRHDDYVIPSTVSKAPIFGALKGLLWIEPGYDLTSPMYTDEEWAEIEKEWEANWDTLLQGMSGSPKK